MRGRGEVSRNDAATQREDAGGFGRWLELLLDAVMKKVFVLDLRGPLGDNILGF